MENLCTSSFLESYLWELLIWSYNFCMSFSGRTGWCTLLGLSWVFGSDVLGFNIYVIDPQGILMLFWGTHFENHRCSENLDTNVRHTLSYSANTVSMSHWFWFCVFGPYQVELRANSYSGLGVSFDNIQVTVQCWGCHSGLLHAKVCSVHFLLSSVILPSITI